MSAPVLNKPKPKRHKLPPHMRRYAILGAVLVAILAYLYPHPRVSHFKYEEGRPWNYAKLIAPFDIPIRPDSATVREATDSLEARFVPIYTRTQLNVDSILSVAGRRMESLPPAPATAPPEQTAAFSRALAHTLRRAAERGILPDSLPANLGTAHRETIRLRNGNVLTSHPRTNYVTRKALLAKIDSLADLYHVTRRLQNSGLAAMVQPTLPCDVDESERILASQRALITIDRGVIQRGQTIIDKGTIITPQDYTNLRTYEAALLDAQTDTGRSDLLITLGQILYITLVITALLAYFHNAEPKLVWDQPRLLTFLMLLVTMITAVAIAVTRFWPAGAYAVPVALAPLLTLVYTNPRCAPATGAATILLTAPLVTFPLEFIAVQAAATAAVTLTLTDLTSRGQLLRAVGAVAVATLGAYTAVQLLTNGSFDDFTFHIVVSLLASAALLSLAYIIMWGAERLFGFVSNITLVELTDTNAPLLRELSDECPGTFQHSLAVATLAADAARAIGANELLTRAGAMYHDIGKLDNPIFFTENQHGVNPHDGLTPERSARIIVHHVTDGLRRAQQAGLPHAIYPFISQHHGHGTARYFYITACNANPGKEIDPTPYTYPGSNPDSRETSILMMADAVEAASRSLQDHSQQSISALIDRIVDNQIADHLHDNSPLSFRDIPRIKSAFLRRLTTLYHSRIAYPSKQA